MGYCHMIFKMTGILMIIWCGLLFIWIKHDHFRNSGNVALDRKLNNERAYTTLHMLSTSYENAAQYKIPDSAYQHIKHLVEIDEFILPICGKKDKLQQVEKNNFMFIKTKKCATDTLSAVFRRFALNRNLSVGLPLGTRYLLGWPHSLQPYMYRPAKTANRLHNIFLDHVVFNYTFMTSVLPGDAVYITSVREPFERLRSSIFYFRFNRRVFWTINNQSHVVEKFLKDMPKWDNLYKSPDHIDELGKLRCTPPGVSLTKNGNAFDLGFPTGFHFNTIDETNNYQFIKQWLTDIHSQIKLIFVVEYFHESLILLKRFMCWSWKDILYKKSNVSNRLFRQKYNFNASHVHAYKQWSNIDTLLYNLANATLWNRINKLGKEDFLEEVREFEVHLEKMLTFCNSADLKLRSSMLLPSTKWNAMYTLSHIDCEMINDQQDLRDDIRRAYDNNNNFKVPDHDLTEGHILDWC